MTSRLDEQVRERSERIADNPKPEVKVQYHIGPGTVCLRARKSGQFHRSLGLLEAAATFEDQITVCADALTGEPCSFTRSFFEMAQRFSQVNSMNHLPAELRGLSLEQMLAVLPSQPCEGFSCSMLADVASERNAIEALELGVVAVTGEFVGGAAFSLFGRVARAGLGVFGRRLAQRRAFNFVTDFIGPEARTFRNNAGDLIIETKDGLRQVRFDINNFAPHDRAHVHVIRWKNVKNVKTELFNLREFPKR